ncbi:branched-chain amino acid transaminase [Legionella cardiaca]|uniref:Branched-chain-amino-acid aminotransferase n=1 Tax=Legionella cardiaca TaxID=1071983 RepID=A0ABY8AYT7_9GAMM|nr:branched-chain amino acid transaminase [Legionella cardiaca]WED44307.1 branched-chain amino acid transaminase [Legionella cardiaca]
MMQTTETIWRNGKLIPWDDAKIHVLSHTLHYGGGAFEGIRFYSTLEGPAIFRLNDHIDRLFYSAKTLKMPLSFTKEEVIAAVKDIVRLNKLDAGYIRPIVFYGYGKMGVNPVGNPVELVIACWPWGAYLPHDSVQVKTSSYIRIHPDSTVVDAKLCGHYLNSILASLELQGTHYHEALFLDSNGYITEGVGENFFMVKDGVIYTPNLGGILSGITRDTIIKLARTFDLNVVETNIRLDEVYQADEAFFTGTAAEVTAIHSINDKPLGKGSPGAITSKIKEAYLDLVHGRNNEFKNYLTYVNAY